MENINCISVANQSIKYTRKYFLGLFEVKT